MVPQVPVPGYPGNSPIDNIKNVHSINGRYHCLNDCHKSFGLAGTISEAAAECVLFRHGCRNIIFNGQTRAT